MAKGKMSTAGAPPLRASLGSVQKVFAWIHAETAAGRLSSTASREHTAAARGMLASLRQRHAESELAEMRALVRRAEVAAEFRLQGERQDRYRDDPDLYMRRPAGAPPAPADEPVPMRRRAHEDPS